MKEVTRMRVGFHTNAFVWAGVNDLAAIVDFAVQAGFTCLEVGPGIPLEEAAFEKALGRIGISNFIYCRNFIADDEEAARAEREELYRRMRFASSLGVRKMVLSTGISQKLSLPASGGCDPMASLDTAVAFLSEALELAEKLNMMLLIENCPMYRNIATSPVMWQALFEKLPTPRLGLCYDPSHFVWQMIDPIAPTQEFGGRIRHLHLKDTWLDRELLNRVGILHNVGAERGFRENQWWRHTVIGEGEIDWSLFRQELDAIGYEGDYSFEMEDYLYECEPAKVRKGLAIQREYLRTHWKV